MKLKKLIGIFLVLMMIISSSTAIFASSDTVTSKEGNIIVQKVQVYPENNNARSASVSAPSYIIYTLFADPDDLRTIKLTVELEDCITPVTSFNGLITIANSNGTQTSTTSVSGSMFYSKTWTITKPITSTIEETINFGGGSVTQALKDYINPNLQVKRTNQVGGSYNSIVGAMGGERHHLIAQENISATTINKYDSNKKVIGTVTAGTAPCILLTSADHQKTASYGNSASAIAYRASQLALVRQGKYLQAMENDMLDLRRSVGRKYDNAYIQAMQYARSLGWYQ